MCLLQETFPCGNFFLAPCLTATGKKRQTGMGAFCKRFILWCTSVGGLGRRATKKGLCARTALAICRRRGTRCAVDDSIPSHGSHPHAAGSVRRANRQGVTLWPTAQAALGRGAAHCQGGRRLHVCVSGGMIGDLVTLFDATGEGYREIMPRRHGFVLLVCMCARWTGAKKERAQRRSLFALGRHAHSDQWSKRMAR